MKMGHYVVVKWKASVFLGLLRFSIRETNVVLQRMVFADLQGGEILLGRRISFSIATNNKYFLKF